MQQKYRPQQLQRYSLICTREANVRISAETPTIPCLLSVKEGSEGGKEGEGKKEGNIPVSFAYEVRFKGKQVKEGRQYSSIFCIRS